MTDEVETQEQEIPEGLGGVQPNAVPCTIHLLNGKTFIVNDIDSWAWMPQGVFASGHFKGYSGKQDILIMNGQVDYVELDFAGLKRYLSEHGSEPTHPSA